MKKKSLSFMTLFMLTTALVGGCSCNKRNDETINNLVFKIGDKEYSAKQLFNELLDNSPNEAFAKVLRLVVENSMETTSNIQAAADLAEESFEEEVTNDSLTYGTSKDESREKLLKEKGYSSVDEMKADIIYEQKLTRLTDQYWEDNKERYYNEFVEARLPYLVRHVLVKTDSTNTSKIANNVAISASDAEKLYDVIKRFEEGNKFSTVALEESEDTGSTSTGGAYYMDNTYGANGFVDEFVYGTYAFDAFTTKNVDQEGKLTSYSFGKDAAKYSKLMGLSDTETFSQYYENGFNFVDMKIVNLLGDVYNQSSNSNKDFFSIGAYEEKDNDGDITYETATGNPNSQENYYARSILFNRAFNKPGVSVIGYNSEQEAIDAGAVNYIEFKLNEYESKYILTDQDKNPIFFVAARGSNNDLWIHFLTINVSALDDLENAKKFFSLEQDDDDNYTTYVELMNIKNTTQGANTYIDEIESYVKSYATLGVGNTIGEESLLNYDMVSYYMNTKNISFLENSIIKDKLTTYINNRRTNLKTKLLNTVTDDWNTHTRKLKENMSELVRRDVKPYECAVLVSDDVLSSDNPYNALINNDELCRYVYGKGYQVQLSYFYQTGDSFTRISKGESGTVYFDGDSGYKQWVTIGEENSNHIVLPTPHVADGKYFEGWYTDKALTHKVTSVDLSESRVTNQTIFFAKIISTTATTFRYTYQFADGTPLDSNILVNNTNVDTKTYDASGDNTVTFAKENITSSFVDIVSIKRNGEEISNFTLTQANRGEEIEIVVTVAPKATTIEYEYVDSEGNSVESPGNQSGEIATFTYNTSGDNNVNIDLNDFNWEDGSNSHAVRFKVARNEAPFEDAVEITGDEHFVIGQSDMGQTIKVYIIVEEAE